MVRVTTISLSGPSFIDQGSGTDQVLAQELVLLEAVVESHQDEVHTVLHQVPVAMEAMSRSLEAVVLEVR
jgi:hypothetical protein